MLSSHERFRLTVVRCIDNYALARLFGCDPHVSGLARMFLHWSGNSCPTRLSVLDRVMDGIVNACLEGTDSDFQAMRDSAEDAHQFFGQLSNFVGNQVKKVSQFRAKDSAGRSADSNAEAIAPSNISHRAFAGAVTLDELADSFLSSRSLRMPESSGNNLPDAAVHP